jgi:hypothetical protein
MKFNCVECQYCCDKLSEWTKHTNTRKHLSRIGVEQKKSPSKFLCGKCDKEYSVRSSLWYHERKCGIEKQIEKPFSQTEQEKSPYLDIINKLLTDNMELRNFIIEQSKTTADAMNKVIEQAAEHKKDTIEIVNKVIENVKPTNNTINGNVNNNQKFNINLFLNEQCKDAMNFSDFIKNIEVSREDLENNAQLGFVNGVSKILIESLKQLDKTERPIHCTDIKRETMYIKDDDKWNKEEDATKLNKAIQEVTRKSMGTLMNWKEENPDYKDRDSEFSNRCIVIQQQSMAAHNRDTYYPKVIKAVAKEVVVDK